MWPGLERLTSPVYGDESSGRGYPDKALAYAKGDALPLQWSEVELRAGGGNPAVGKDRKMDGYTSGRRGIEKNSKGDYGARMILTPNLVGSWAWSQRMEEELADWEGNLILARGYTVQNRISKAMMWWRETEGLKKSVRRSMNKTGVGERW